MIRYPSPGPTIDGAAMCDEALPPRTLSGAAAGGRLVQGEMDGDPYAWGPARTGSQGGLLDRRLGMTPVSPDPGAWHRQQPVLGTPW